MNLMLTATCDSVDNFRTDYEATKHEFTEWCDASRCVFAKIDDTHLIELFFDVNPAKLKEWLARPSTQDLFKRNGFVPTRYTFTPLQMG